MQNYALTHNLTPFISMQNNYSLLYREEEREMFPTLKVCPPLFRAFDTLGLKFHDDRCSA